MGTADEVNYRLPAWSPRLRKAQIARLYETSGRGLVDEEWREKWHKNGWRTRVQQMVARDRVAKDTDT